MQAGMWGGTRDAVPEMLALLRSATTSDAYIADQEFLRDRVWPLAVARGVVQHDSFGCREPLALPEQVAPEAALPFPAVGRSHSGDFVGAVVLGDGGARPDDDAALAAAAQPAACRDRPTLPFAASAPVSARCTLHRAG
jgi:hypothetical protein